MYIIKSGNMISLAICRDKHLKIFQRLQISLDLRARVILLSILLKNFLVLTNPKLHPKSFYHLYLQKRKVYRVCDIILLKLCNHDREPASNTLI